MHNTYGFAFQKMFHEMYTTKGIRTWMQSRGNYLGGQRFSTSSYSDGYSYPTYVKGLVNSGFTGLAWAPEVRYATCDADYARRIQLMLLGSQSQFNAWERGDLPFDCSGEMWDVFVRHYDLRTRLVFYLYTSFYTMSRTGFPIVAPLPLAFPGDTAARKIDDQLLLGPSLMFAPGGLDGAKQGASIVPASNSTTRSVLFPAATIDDTTIWWNFWTKSKASQASTTKVMDTPVVDAPLYVRGGSIVPMLVSGMLPSASNKDSETDNEPSDTDMHASTLARRPGLELLIALDQQGIDGRATGSLFMDDFESLRTVDDGKYLLVDFSVALSKLTSNVSHAPASGTLDLRSHGIGSQDRDVRAIESVEVWGVNAAVSNVTLAIGGSGRPVVVPKAQWTHDKSVLRVTSLVNVSLMQPFELAWE